MTDVQVPGIGAVDKRYVYGGAAAAATFVGWKWWQARSSPVAAPGLASEGTAPDASYGAPGVGASSGTYSNPAPGRLGGGGATYDAGTASGSAPKTDQAWTQAVVTDLQNLGYNPQAVSVALAAYLASQQLTADQVTIIRQAWAFEGRPPGNPNLGIQQGAAPEPVPETPAPAADPLAIQHPTDKPVTMTVGRNHYVGEVVEQVRAHGYPNFNWADFWEYNPGIADKLEWQPNGDWKFTGWSTQIVVAVPNAYQNDALGQAR